MRFATVGLASGLRLHYAEEGDTGGAAILFLHGWPDSWFTFSRVIPFLPAGARSLAVDQRGFGRSDRPESGYAIEDLAEDAVAFLDALSIKRATVAGHSMGAFVARRVAIAHPDRVDRLVLIGSGLSSASPVLAEAREIVAKLEDPLPLEFVREFQSGTAYAPIPDDFLDGVVSESHRAPARVWRDALEGLLAYQDAQQLAGLAAPTLLIWGDHDAVFESEEEQRQLAATIPNATLKVYAETGHCPNWERPEQVASDIAAFLAV